MRRPTSAWVERLSSELQEREELYIGHIALAQGRLDADTIGAPDLAGADHHANASLILAKAVSDVLTALSELDAFSQHEGLSPLHDLVSALLDVSDGIPSPLFSPRAGIGRGQDGSAHNYVKAHVVWSAQALQKVGYGNRAACECVASIFRKSGLRGRKGMPISWKTVDYWVGALNEDGAAFVKSLRQKLPQPQNQTDALSAIQALATNPLLTSKF